MLNFSLELSLICGNLLSAVFNIGLTFAVVSIIWLLVEALRNCHGSANLEIAKKSLQEEKLRLETANALLDRARVINELGHYPDPDNNRHER